jgi:hypothetical protein
LLVEVNSRIGLYRLIRGKLGINELQLATSGWMISRSDRHDMDLAVSSGKASLADLLSVLPDAHRSKLQSYRLEGQVKTAIRIRGRYNGSHLPAVKAELRMEDGVLGLKKSSICLENVRLTTVYSAGPDAGSEMLNITGLESKLKNGKIAGSLRIAHFSSPRILAVLRADVDLEDVRQFLNNDSITDLKGRLFADCRFEGMLADRSRITVSDFNRCSFRGIARISEGVFGLKGVNLPATRIIGSFGFDNNNLKINDLSFQFGKSDFRLKGVADNLLAWLMIKNEKLFIHDASVSSDLTLLDELSESNSGSGEYRFRLPENLEISNLKVNVKKFSFRKFSAGSISAKLDMQDRQFTASGIRMQSMKGFVSGQASLNASNPEHSFIQAKVKLSNVNLKSLFAEFGNFGSTDLTSGNLDGAVSSDAIFAAMIYPNLEIDPESVKLHADVRVENGRLVNYAPMLGLSNFLKVEDLSDIRFATLENQVDIANRIIYIPDMQIKSNAIDLSLMGTHTFSNELEYHFSLALTDLLAAKFHRKNPGIDKQLEFGPVKEDGRRRTMVYVSLTGTLDNPVFGYDKKANRAKIATDLRDQKSELKEAFRREFSSMKNDTIGKSQQIKEKAVRKKQEEGKFVIEWDDEKK